MERVRLLANIAIAVLIPYLVIYPVLALDFQIRMVWWEPGLWENHRWVTPGAVISPLTKVAYFVLWLVPTAFGLAALWAALSIARCFRAGQIFEDRVAVLVMRLGWTTSLSAVFAIIGGSLSPKVVSWHNVDGPLDLRLWLSEANLSLILCGLAFLVMGAVLREGIAMARENEAFV